MSINKSIISEAILHANDDANRTVDVRAGVLSLHYYEDIFSPTISAKVQIVNAGGACFREFDPPGQAVAYEQGGRGGFRGRSRAGGIQTRTQEATPVQGRAHQRRLHAHGVCGLCP